MPGAGGGGEPVVDVPDADEGRREQARARREDGGEHEARGDGAKPGGHGVKAKRADMKPG